MGIPRGTTIGSVVVDEPLPRQGSGDDGDLYRGRQRGLDREVTVRVLPRDRSGPTAERFFREARFAARVAHPGLLQVFDCLARDGEVFLVREHVDGDLLREALDRARDSESERIRPELAARMALELAVALEQLHLHAVVHTDLRPANVRISRKGELKLDGLGAAREPGEAAPDPATLDPAYAAPELLRGAHVDPRADVYSLGALLEELLAGRPPGSAHADSLAAPRRLRRLIRACRAASPALRPELSEVMERLRVAAGDVDSRSQQSELANWLWQVRVRSRARELRPEGAEEPGARPVLHGRPPPVRRRRRTLGGGAAAAGVLVLWGVALLIAAAREPQLEVPAVSAPPPAALTLAVYPWASVKIDGESSFYTPRAAPVELTPGQHEVVLEHPRHGSVRRVLDLRAGEHRTLRHAFVPREPEWDLQ
jgi:hypothetical protein